MLRVRLGEEEVMTSKRKPMTEEEIKIHAMSFVDLLITQRVSVFDATTIFFVAHGVCSDQMLDSDRAKYLKACAKALKIAAKSRG